MASFADCPICESPRVFRRFRLKRFDVMKCPDCSVLMMADIPTDEVLETLYSNEYYETRSEYYFNNRIWNPGAGRNNENIESFDRALSRLRQLEPAGKSLLDVGCGLGIFLAMARDAGWNVKGIDTSEYAIRHAREHFQLDVTHGAVLKDAEFAPASFDVITLWDSIEHFRDPFGQLSEIYRLLKPGGVIMLDTPNGHSLLRTVANACYDASFGLFRYPVAKLYHQFHLFYYTPQALETLLKRTGFHIRSVELGQIPIVKARGSYLEKQLVRVFQKIEKHTGRAFELIAVAEKPPTEAKA